MGFRINHNITALVAQGKLLKNQGAIATSIERLSSGLRINRGADDAAGLTISEKLRGQIKGLNRAVLNAQDGISLIQTAEGALNEDATILNRMRELAIQASSDTLTTNDRLEIQKEVDQLVSEVDRIANTTEFNTKKLLDGTATAIVSVNDPGLKGIQVGSTQSSSGDYEIELNLSTVGTRQQQASNILTDKESNNLVTLDTKLGDIDFFYDNEGNNILTRPIELTVRGNANNSKITLSSDVSIGEFTQSLKDLITKDVSEGGLGVKGTDVSFDKKTGQIILTSGIEGSSGDIFFAADENLIKAFGFQETVPSKDPAYRASAVQQGVDNPIKNKASTTTNRFSGLIPGVDVQFSPPTSAFIEGDLTPNEVITIGTNDLHFRFGDTNSGGTQAVPTDSVEVTLIANTTYTLVSIQNIINSNISSGRDELTNTGVAGTARFDDNGPGGLTDGIYTPPNIRASFSGSNLILSSGTTGSSAKISIFQANSAATNILGIQNGVFLGDSGQKSRIVGSKDVSAGLQTGNPLGPIFEIIGPDGRSTGTINAPGQSISFSPGANISTTSLTTTINNRLNAVGIQATATIDANGRLVLESFEDGEDTALQVLQVQGNLTDLGFVNGIAASGKGGQAANFIGNTNQSFVDIGYTFDTTTRFEVIDQFGASSGDIVFGTATVEDAAAPLGGLSPSLRGGSPVATTNNITLSKASISAIMDASSINTTDIAYEFDSGGKLRFRSKSVGDSSRILLISKDPRLGATSSNAAVAAGEPASFTSATSQTTMLSTFGIDGSQAAQGSGKTKYSLHISDRSFSLQIGANQNQTLESSIANFSAEALGLNGLDVTSFPAAVKALGAIDHAVNLVSSERSKLGSLQNRLTSTINNLTVTSTNLQAAESRIRDVDIAVETVNFTRTQILIQAGTAQLAQANALPQQALQLLGG
ncbi:MAG: hypothetical protein COB02_04595 [Candidatus Cloacimonadota bacterium]|nr:MAG: hypothetical protein COB02_04595 [Candidatus Cloacimonadota bacterium]